MDPKTKREAEEAVKQLETKAARWREREDAYSVPQSAGFMAAGYRADADWAESEAARLRALLPTLPD